MLSEDLMVRPYLFIGVGFITYFDFNYDFAMDLLFISFTDITEPVGVPFLF